VHLFGFTTVIYYDAWSYKRQTGLGVRNKISVSKVDLCGSGQGPVASSCEYDNEASMSVAGREFSDHFSE
jgi:hypothetical protein